MFVEVNQKIRIPLEIGQLYLLGKQTNGLGNKSKHFIELEAEVSKLIGCNLNSCLEFSLHIFSV